MAIRGNLLEIIVLFLSTHLPFVASASATLTSCLSSANLQPISSSSANYTADSLAFNRRLSYKPTDIVFPTNNQDVASAINCASQAGVKVAARSGGHSYAANGVGGEDGSLVIDLKNLNSVQVTASNQTAVFGTGIHLGDLALALFNGGEQAMAHGTCPYIGTGGHLGCGSFGLPSRLWGLALDAVIEAQVVLANGSIVTASSTENQDVFFAIRGAAPSFGVITSFTVKTQSAPASNVFFNYVFSPLNVTAAIETFLAYQNFGANNALRTLGMNVVLGNGDFEMSGVFYGPISNFTAVIQPLLDAVPQQPKSQSVKTYNWLGILQQLAGSDGSLNTSTKADVSDTFYAKSLMVDEDAPLTKTALQSFFQLFVDLWGGSSSAVNAVPSNETAFSHRSTLYTFQFYASSSNSAPPYPSDGISFVDGMVSSITSNMSGTDFGMYSCYVDPQLSAAEAQKVYYGNATITRLQNIKSQVDPTNLFSFPQAIETVLVPESSTKSAARRGAAPSAAQLGVVSALLTFMLETVHHSW
ncbi:Glucooligosaccharide oxidase [Piloderma croceum F 1598]|uniref:Glucooligosaccharide oxidase n=1 Tax=Piloderma croceum (strain F 1598) TaxID=765440 RepID=A0A0C3G5G7_PILCF|nr:Glucooligosaccharide oxidase [Piloderma croceum F 1598]